MLHLSKSTCIYVNADCGVTAVGGLELEQVDVDVGAGGMKLEQVVVGAGAGGLDVDQACWKVASRKSQGQKFYG